MRRSLAACVVLLMFLLATSSVALLAQATKTPSRSADHHAAAPATKDEVEALRGQVAAQQETIEELRAMVQRLASQQSSGEPQVVNAAFVQSQPGDRLLAASQTSQEQPSKSLAAKAPKPSNNLEWTVGGTTGSHKINDYLTGIFQFETEVMFTATPGPTSDDQCRYCLGSRDSFVGVKGPWGAIKLGKENPPYKKALIPVDPFYRTIADHRTIMGNSGGDNRAEFEPRYSHAIWYESPAVRGLEASILFSPGQNRSSDNGAYARAEPNCTGGNGVFVMSYQNQANTAEGADLYSLFGPDINPCNDGSFSNAVSAALTYKNHGLYGFAAYAHHSGVNRTTDLVGVADEAAWRLGLSYTFEKTGTTGTFVYEALKRYAANTISAIDGQPFKFPALDERTRPLATMAVVSQKLSKKDVLNAEWIHAGKTPGDPGQCAAATGGLCTDFASLGGVPGTAASLDGAVNNQTNMYAFGLKHTLTRNMSTYFVAARQANHADAHYDLGAGGHGAVVDKRDFTGKGFAGTRLQGVSGGMTFSF